jgi:hypothetical protein
MNLPPHSAKRAPRVNLGGKVSATVQLENGRQLYAKLHQLSLTGGLLELTAYLEERSRVGLTISVGSDPVYPRAEMLFPMKTAQGYLQPFRTTFLRDPERQALEKQIASLLKQSLAPGKPGHALGSRSPRFLLETF